MCVILIFLQFKLYSTNLQPLSVSESHTSGSNPASIHGKVSEWGNGARDNERYLSARWARPSSTDANFSVFEQSCSRNSSFWLQKLSLQPIVSVHTFGTFSIQLDDKFNFNFPSESHTSRSNPASIMGKVSKGGNGAMDNERYLSARLARPSSIDAYFSVS